MRKTRLPRAARMRCARSIAASSSPPIMKTRSAATAPLSPPETDASTRLTPRRASKTPSSRVASGSDEVVSITMLPGRNVAASAASPPSVRTARTTAPVGSMVRMTDASASSASDRGWRVANAWAKRSLRSRSASYARTSCPARTRWPAIGHPMVPMPMTPIVSATTVRLTASAQRPACLAARRCAAGRPSIRRRPPCPGC